MRHSGGRGHGIEDQQAKKVSVRCVRNGRFLREQARSAGGLAVTERNATFACTVVKQNASFLRRVCSLSMFFRLLFCRADLLCGGS